MNDSEIIARLIYCAWIGPAPETAEENKDLEGFKTVLDCYARAKMREEKTEALPDHPHIPDVYTVPAPRNTICVMGPGAEHVKIICEKPPEISEELPAPDPDASAPASQPASQPASRGGG